MALYEAPLIVDASRPVTTDDWTRISAAIAAGRRSEAVQLFPKSVGAPGLIVALMRLLPLWSKLKAVAPTLPHDGAIVQKYQRGASLPADRWVSVTVPTLVMAGGKSPVWLRNGMQTLRDVLPNAQYRTLARQTHNVSAKPLAVALKQFFNGQTGKIA